MVQLLFRLRQAVLGPGGVPPGERELEDEGESSNVTLDSNYSNNLFNFPIFRKRELDSLFVGNL